METLETLRRKIDRAGQLASVVSAMRALATMSIGQYERAVQSLDDYQRTVHLGLAACMRSGAAVAVPQMELAGGTVTAVVFGSDQGLVGQFNDIVADFARQQLAGQPVDRLWLVGERVAARFEAADAAERTVLVVPSSVGGIAPLVTRVLAQVEDYRAARPGATVHIFFNKVKVGAAYEPAGERLLPLDAQWRQQFLQLRWPTHNLPEVVGSLESALRAHLREYLFISLFRACAESLASENASRLAAMHRAERNIETLTQHLKQAFNGLRQATIDAELFDVMSGFEALAAQSAARRARNRGS